MIALVPHSRPAKVQALPVPHSLVLQGMRAWVAGLHRHPNAYAPVTHAAVADTMRRLGAEDAGPYLEGFMRALWHGAIRPVAIGHVGQRFVGADERLLLAVLTFAQEGRPSEALLLLRNLVAAAAAGIVLRIAEALATEMALAGCFLASSDLAMPDTAPACRPAASQPGPCPV